VIDTGLGSARSELAAGAGVAGVATAAAGRTLDDGLAAGVAVVGSSLADAGVVLAVGASPSSVAIAYAGLGVPVVASLAGPAAVYFVGEVDAGEYVALEPGDTVLEILVVNAVDRAAVGERDRVGCAVVDHAASRGAVLEQQGAVAGDRHNKSKESEGLHAER